MAQRIDAGTPAGGQFAATAKAEADITLTDPSAETPPPAGFATERKNGILTVTCLGCEETNSQPDKGLGRANIGAWKTRHQH